ncbi:MAG: hypothetical protein ACTXOO_01355 [Sodalis sp. (in: enterobacteria)]
MDSAQILIHFGISESLWTRPQSQSTEKRVDVALVISKVYPIRCADSLRFGN